MIAFAHLAVTPRRLCARVTLTALLAAILGATASCGSRADGPTGVWSTEGSSQAGSVESYRGDEHCEWESAIFLNVKTSGTSGETDVPRQYVRDPEGKVSKPLRATYVPDASLPPDAKPLGYRKGSVRLYLSAGEPRHAYLVDKSTGRTEAWPIAPKIYGCD